MMRALLTRLARDERGASIVEMAMVAPVLATLFIGMVDVSNAYSMKLQLEQAAQRSIEKVMQYRTTYSTYTTLQNEAATAAGVSTAAVTVEYWHECNGVKQATYNTVCTGTTPTEARYISVEIDKNFTPRFGTRFFPGANADGSFTITAKAGIRTQ